MCSVLWSMVGHPYALVRQTDRQGTAIHSLTARPDHPPASRSQMLSFPLCARPPHPLATLSPAWAADEQQRRKDPGALVPRPSSLALTHLRRPFLHSCHQRPCPPPRPCCCWTLGPGPTVSSHAGSMPHHPPPHAPGSMPSMLPCSMPTHQQPPLDVSCALRSRRPTSPPLARPQQPVTDGGTLARPPRPPLPPVHHVPLVPPLRYAVLGQVHPGWRVLADLERRRHKFP